MEKFESKSDYVMTIDSHILDKLLIGMKHFKYTVNWMIEIHRQNMRHGGNSRLIDFLNSSILYHTICMRFVINHLTILK